MGAQAVAIPEGELSRGTRVGRFVVSARARQGTDGVVLQARDEDGSFVALRLAVTGAGAELVARETRLFGSLGGACKLLPALVGAGSGDRGPYCATAWRQGAEARVAAREPREQGRAAELLDLAARIARAYATLHAHGITHGQVHPRHVLVDIDGSVALVDFTVAQAGFGPPPAPLLAARFNSLSAPEQAESLLAGEEVGLTPAAEQYSLAALLYLLITGRMYARLRLERRTLPHDIIDSAPVPFVTHGAETWPQVEAILGRSLQKQPSDRYASVDDLAEALAGVEIDGARHSAMPKARPVQPPLARLLETFCHSTETVGRLPPPRCSINLGAAGVAFALTRLGKVTGDGVMFECAEHWLGFAEHGQTERGAFDDGGELTPDIVGRISPFHSASGLVAVRALLSEATGDSVRQQAALDDFRRATDAACASLDLTLGRSSVLLFAALLYATAEPGWPAAQRLAAYGDELCASICRACLTEAVLYYGIAHGFAGIAYATLMWSRARGIEPPPVARDVLDMLARVAEPCERGLRWPLSPDAYGAVEYWPGWCHGNAGYVFLWNLARATYGDDTFAELAERAARLAGYPAGVNSLCCGTAGQSYALLNQYRHTGEERWRTLAAQLANRAASADALAEDASTPLSLYKGDVGLGLLAAELECSAHTAMPLFEFEVRPNDRNDRHA